jgi:hypothetical protein
LPTKQYQCGKKFVASSARELNHSAKVAQARTSNPSFAKRGENPCSDFVSSEVLAAIRGAASPWSRVQESESATIFNCSGREESQPRLIKESQYGELAGIRMIERRTARAADSH